MVHGVTIDHLGVAPKLEWRAKMDCIGVAVSGDGCTCVHVCIQSVVRGVHVYEAVWTPVVTEPPRYYAYKINNFCLVCIHM